MSYVHCSFPDCPKKVYAAKVTMIKAHYEGWFFTKNDQQWCPDHLPAWVGPWRERNSRGTDSVQ